MSQRQHVGSYNGSVKEGGGGGGGGWVCMLGCVFCCCFFVLYLGGVILGMRKGCVIDLTFIL